MPILSGLQTPSAGWRWGPEDPGGHRDRRGCRHQHPSPQGTPHTTLGPSGISEHEVSQPRMAPSGVTVHGPHTHRNPEDTGPGVEPPRRGGGVELLGQSLGASPALHPRVTPVPSSFARYH